MDSSLGPNRLDIFEIYRRYCGITSDAYTYKVDDYIPVTLNESKKDKFHRDSLSYLLQQQVPTLEDVSVLMSRLNLMTDSSEFTRFYNFMFFLCRENGQRSITVSRAIMAWKLILSGRFRLLNQWCSFVEKNQRHNISEDTWWQVLSFSRCVHENLEGYDPEGAWPVLIDEFVEHMYRINGSEDAHSVSCSDLEVQLTDDTLPGLKIFPGVKRKSVGDLQDQEFTNFNTVLNSKKRFTDLSTDQTYDCSEAVKQNSPLGSGSLSKDFAELLSSPSCLQFDRETRVPYTL